MNPNESVRGETDRGVRISYPAYDIAMSFLWLNRVNWFRVESTKKETQVMPRHTPQSIKAGCL